MSEALSFLLPSIIMCFLLVGIHCYLGLQVLKRGIVFIDLSLAQVASLGSTMALLFHIEHHGSTSYLISLSFTLLASLYFAWVQKVQKNISQEVIIAIVYAFSAAAVVLTLNSLAHGSEHIKEVLIGKILWVSWEDVMKTFGIYTFVALIHYRFRKQLLQKDPNFLWSFIFYALFGIVITSSVGLAGILLVFSFLIIPAQFSLLIESNLKKQLLKGWGLGFLLSSLGMYLSYSFDLPAGAVIVTCFTLFGILFFPFTRKS